MRTYLGTTFSIIHCFALLTLVSLKIVKTVTLPIAMDSIIAMATGEERRAAAAMIVPVRLVTLVV